MVLQGTSKNTMVNIVLWYIFGVFLSGISVPWYSQMILFLYPVQAHYFLYKNMKKSKTRPPKTWTMQVWKKNMILFVFAVVQQKSNWINFYLLWVIKGLFSRPALLPTLLFNCPLIMMSWDLKYHKDPSRNEPCERYLIFPLMWEIWMSGVLIISSMSFESLWSGSY